MLLCFFDRKADIINKIKTFKKMPRLSRTKEENEVFIHFNQRFWTNSFEKLLNSICNNMEKPSVGK